MVRLAVWILTIFNTHTDNTLFQKLATHKQYARYTVTKQQATVLNTFQVLNTAVSNDQYGRISSPIFRQARMVRVTKSRLHQQEQSGDRESLATAQGSSIKNKWIDARGGMVSR